jgi:hypothetical protein
LPALLRARALKPLLRVLRQCVLLCGLAAVVVARGGATRRLEACKVLLRLTAALLLQA